MIPDAADLTINAAAAWIGAARAERLLRGRAARMRRWDADALGAEAGLSPARAKALADFAATFDAAAEMRALARPGVRALRAGTPDYPVRLTQGLDAPPYVFVEGALPGPEDLVVAVVGSRRPTEYGLRMARTLAAGLARAGVWVVSGLAHGIDIEAHRACLEAGGRTVAVLGSGLDCVWPREHQPWARRMVAEGGGVLSQFSMAAPPMPRHFPLRNGIISALSRGVVVVEGARGSGSLITAELALQQGREVFAVPGPADAPLSQGPLDLIRDGASLVRDADELLREWGLAVRKVPVERPRLPVRAPESPAGRVLDRLESGPADADELARRCGLDAAGLAAALTDLEMAGAVRRLAGNRWERSAG